MTHLTKYGVISDVHKDPRIVPLAIEVLKKQGAQKLLVNGDIGTHADTLQESQDYTAFILEAIGKSGLESYVQPGSHESVGSFQPVADYFKEKYPNMICFTNPTKIKLGNHDLIFLPGTDFSCGGEYLIGGNSKIPSGQYAVIDESRIVSANLAEFMQLVRREKRDWKKLTFMHYQNIHDLKNLVTDPEKTIVVCHVPRKFNGLETCVDVAEFGETQEGFKEYIVLDKENKEKSVIETPDMDHYSLLENIKSKGLKIKNIKNVYGGSVFPLTTARYFQQGGANIEIRRENRGNEDLKSLYEELGITKAVSGHFHESGHKANDSEGNHVQEGQQVNNLFWNTGHLDIGQTGILTVYGEQVSYKNISLQDYIN